MCEPSQKLVGSIGIPSLLTCLAGAVGCQPTVTAELTPPIKQLTDIAGEKYTAFEPRSCGSVMLFWLQDCPIANAYAPEVSRLVEEFAPRGVRWFVVQVDRELTVVAARQHAVEYGLKCPVILEGAAELIRAAGARGRQRSHR